MPNDGSVVICNPARYLYQAAKVLFVDKTAVPQPGEITSTGTNAATPSGAAQTSVNTGLITLEVPATAAQLIASIAPEELYLTLLPQNYKAPRRCRSSTRSRRCCRARTPRSSRRTAPGLPGPEVAGRQGHELLSR